MLDFFRNHVIHNFWLKLTSLGPNAANEAWSRRLHAAGEVLPAAGRKEAQGQKAQAPMGLSESE